jgi:hypothetical protein
MKHSIIETLIPSAVQAIKTHLVESASTMKVKNEYLASISSFGKDIYTCGLLPTVAMYSHSSQGVDEKQLLKALFDVLKTYKKSSDMDEINTLFEYLLPLKGDKTLVQQEIIQCAIALKLAMRTFDIQKNKEQ